MNKRAIGRKTANLQGCAVLLIAVGAVAFLLWRNAQPQVQFVPPLPPTAAPVQGTIVVVDNSLHSVLSGPVLEGMTLMPTYALPTYLTPTPFTPEPAALIDPAQVPVAPTLVPTRPPRNLPTSAGVTAVPSPAPLNVVGRNSNPRLGQWSLPPEQVPMSRDLRDHFYFRRPVDSNANSSSLSYYPYGSNGPEGAWRVHHGLDMPNPDGQPVRAAGDGVVVWAADHYRWSEEGVTDGAESYGNVVIIEHTFGYEGQRLFTLYAHLSRIIVSLNEPVTVGQIVGLSGHSGNVTGPHVHFEVRQGQNFYWTTRNPLLWMAPLLGSGVVAGRVLYRDGSAVEHAPVTLSQGGRQFDTTVTYVNPKRTEGRNHDVDGDDKWHENFVLGDIPAGKYDISVLVNGTRITRQVEVQAGTTSFVDFNTALTAASP